MDVKKKIAGKRILVVDDERDILDTLAALLDICKIDTASSFEEGKRLLETNDYDIAVLDIMGVRGFDLLNVANKRGIPALMLTAHALSEENLKKSAENGAYYYAPKDEINNIDVFIADVLEAKEKTRALGSRCSKDWAASMTENLVVRTGERRNATSGKRGQSR
jgi:DNA-binding response OmpR family regulator